MISTLFYTLWFLLSVTAVIHLLIFKRDPSSTLAWLFFVTGVPIAGALLFLVFGPQRLEREAFKRKKEIEKIIRFLPRSVGDSIQHQSVTEIHSVIPESDAQILKLARQISEYGVSQGNRIEMLPDPHATLQAMNETIEKARHFVHLEYYIIATDEVSQQLFAALLRAAKRGVEVRILYDSLGSLFLKRISFRRLLEAGTKVAGFLPFSVIPQRMNVNFRNHRKILIVDGKVAFTGGTNIGKQYLGRRTKNQWHDYSVRVEGPVCLQLQDVFAKDWQFTTKEDLFHPKYYPPPIQAGDSIVQVLESGPDTAFSGLHQAIFLALTSARNKILLTTPYFIPDPAIITALTVAALRGVEVKILLPLKSDAPLVRHASRSFYDSLLKAGVRIFEYQPRILHAKLLTLDGKWTILGSANMDIRSFRLNFELNLMVYGKYLADQAEQLFLEDLKQSNEIVYEPFMQRPIPQQMLENACRLLSPVL